MVNEVVFAGVIEPPNGDRVTQAILYRTLYELDQGLSKRFTALFEAATGALELTAQLRTDFEEHRVDGHPKTQREETVRAELSLSARKAAVIAGVISVLTAAVVQGVNLLGLIT